MSEQDQTDPDQTDARRAATRAFARRRFGPVGTLRLHRAALGADLLRAPLNVVLAPLYLVVRLLALGLSAIGLKRAGQWLAARRMMLETSVAARVKTDVLALIEGLGPARPAAPRDAIELAVWDYAEVRNAVAEITTTLIVLCAGLLVFHAATPGVLSLAAPVAEMRTQAFFIDNFPLGQWAGGLWYSVFPARPSGLEVVLTGVVLALSASLVTTFAGLVADPLQVLTGTHRRRLMRLLDRLDRAGEGGLAREHVAARMGDLSDMALSLWRSLKG